MVIPNLPRELLWTDRKDFSEFLSEDISSEVVSNIFLSKSHIAKKLGTTTMLKLFNEAFYLSTRIVYEHDAEALPETYAKMILDDLENQEWVEYVILIMFLILTSQKDKSKEILIFVDKLQKQYLPDMPFKLVNIVNKVFKPRKNNKGYGLKPCPYPADMLKNFPLDWRQITQGFSKHVIVGVLDLWDQDNEKGKIIRLIEQAYTSCSFELKDDVFADRTDKEFFTQQKHSINMANDNLDVNFGKDVSQNTLPIIKCFRHNNDFVKDIVTKVVKESFLGKPVNLALIEIVLFDHGQLIKRDNHKLLVKILKEWGAIDKERDEELVANGMSQKIRKLPIGPYQEWSDEYQKDREYCIKIGKKLPQSIPYGR